MNKKLRSMLALLLCLVMVVSMLAACGDDPDVEVPDTVTYNTTTTVMPSNWNEFTYADNNDTQIMSYIGSSFFEYDYKFENDQKYNADGSINKAGIVPGAYTTNYSAATKLEDVTSAVDAKWGYTDAQKKEGGYAWKITLRNDLKWDDGTAITAEDFVWSMKQLLDPDFMNSRANTYYDTLMIKNAKAYFFSGAPIYKQWADWAEDDSIANAITTTTVKDDGYVYVTIGGTDYLVYTSTTDSNMLFGATWGMIHTDYGYGGAGYFDKEYTGDTSNPDALPSYVVAREVKNEAGETVTKYVEDLFLKYNDTENEFGYIPVTPAILEDLKVLAENFAAFGSVGEAGWNTFASYISGYGDEVDWNTVGIYEVEGENAIVLCLDKAYSFLMEDGSLSVWAPYYFSSLPVVHKAKYEASKTEPASGSTLWTSNYNSSLATTASWGPYKLAEFEAGSHYKLVKNENWYGWNLDMYKNQYNIDAVYCRKVEESNTKWLGFLDGSFDDAALDTDNVADYLDSKYVYFTSTSTGTFGMQLFSDLEVLKKSDNNNGILAIQEFRHAFNLALNRSDIVEKIWPGTAVPCFGLINVAYYYDIENSPELDDGGQYRNTTIAKEGILRAYGFTQGDDGKWSSGDLKNLSLDEAYDSLTGYNPTLAKQKMQEAINILTADAEKYGYDATKDITLVYGSSADTDKQRFRADYLQEVLDGLTEGTSLEGKIKVKFDASAGSKWADAFRTGATQIGFGYGFSGNAFNPFDIIGAFVNPDDDLNYHMYWDTSKIDMTLTMPAGNYAGAGETITMSIQNWYYCLNGLAESEEQAKTYNWGEGYAPAEARLMILSALEEVTIKESRSVMLIADGGGSFLGAKFSYFSEDEHTFMGFGGIRYMEVNYNDAEWADFVAQNNNNLEAEYKKSE